VFSGQTGSGHRQFCAPYDGFAGGLHAAASDLDGDGFADIVTGAGAIFAPGGHVKEFSVVIPRDSFFAFDAGSWAGSCGHRASGMALGGTAIPARERMDSLASGRDTSTAASTFASNPDL
jgi:hypothetical protein